jgi:hypothetical protein
MSVLKSYTQGLAEAGRRSKMIALLWLLNFALAAPAYLVFSAATRGTLGESLAAGELLKKTDMNIAFEFITSSGTVLGQIFTVVLILLAFQALASIFVFGGILGVLDHGARGRRFGQVFFGGGGRLYGRFFRLSVYSLALWVPAILVFTIVSALLGLTTKDPAHEQLALFSTIIRALVLAFCFFFIKMVLDYARIKIAATDTRKVFRALVGATRFVFARPAKTLALYYLLGLTALATFGLYMGVQSAFAKTSALAVLLGFLIFQVFVLTRAWIHVAFLAAQKSFFESAGS